MNCKIIEKEGDMDAKFMKRVVVFLFLATFIMAFTIGGCLGGSEKPCIFCEGSGKCKHCKGTGYYEGYSGGCPICKSSGKCIHCSGTGQDV